MLDYGKFNKRIEILSNEQVRDATHALVNKRVTYAKCWACVTEKFGGEYTDAQRIEGNASYLFTLKYSSKINRQKMTSDMMIRYKDELFDIKDINDVKEEHYQIEILCTVHRTKKG